MKTSWFKFYGQDFLTDPKMRQLTIVQRMMWITILCLASQTEDGFIANLDEETLKELTGLQKYHDPTDVEGWDQGDGIFETLQKRYMITLHETGVHVTHWQKRQGSMSTSYERVKKFRDKKKDLNEPKSVTETLHETQMITLEKRREDKKRKERESTPTEKVTKLINSISYLADLPREDLQEFANTYHASGDEVKKVADKIVFYCKSKGKQYKDYRATLQNWLLNDYGKRKTPRIVEYQLEDPNDYKVEQMKRRQ